MVEIDENTVVLGPGARLKDKRETLSISVETMAEKLRLDLALLKKIESDSYDKSTPPAFIRGYLRNYAKEVGLDGNEVVSAFNGFLEAADDIQLSAIGSSNRRIIDKKRYRYGRWLIIIVALLVVIGIVAYLGKFVGNLFESKEQQPAEISLSTESSFADTASTFKHVGSEASEPAAAKPTTRNNKVRTSIPIENEQQQFDDSINVQQAAETQPLQVLSEADAENGELTAVRISLTDQAWFEIRNANDEIIATGIKDAGFQSVYQVLAPLFVNIGKPESVSLMIEGNPIDLSGYRPGQPAKINYPE